jgi:tetratricopeptide (TPR) repeat protein
LANDPDNVPALLMKAYLLTLFDGEHTEIMEIYQRAKDLGTDTTYWAYNIAWLYLGPQGRFDEAIEILELAKLKDPLAFMPRNALAVINLAAGKVSEAGENVRELLTMPDMPAAAFMDVGRALIAGGGMRKVEELLATIGPARVGEAPSISNTRIEYYRVTNQADALQDLLDLLLAHRNKGEYVFPTVVANIYIAQQDYDTALDWLADAVDARDPQFLANAAVNLRRHPVVGRHPRFMTLLRRMNLAE